MVQISLSEQTAERLRAAARRSGAIMAELLEQAIERFLATTWFSTKQPPHSAWSDQQTLIEQEQRVFEARHQELSAISQTSLTPTLDVINLVLL